MTTALPMRSKKYLLIFLLLVSIPIFHGCTARKIKVATPIAGESGDLRTQLDAIFDHPDFRNAFWGVMVQSMDRGEILYSRNVEKLFMPASNMKLLTGTAALLRLGKDYRFQTRLLADGPIENGVLKGSLWVEGYGDPTISSRFHPGDPLQVMKNWAERLKQQGVREIQGDLIGDDRAFEAEPLGNGWPWDDVGNGYSAEIGPLVFNENTVELRISPAPEQGSRVLVEVLPPTDYVQVEISATTCRKGEEEKLALDRPVANNHIRVSGCLPLGSAPSSLKAAVHDPTLFFLTLLRQTLQAEGISVHGSTKAWNTLPLKPEKANAQLLLQHASPPLEEILIVLLKESQNLFAEILLRTMGKETYGLGSFENGLRCVQQVLQRMAVSEKSYIMVDGSGLSRYNFISPDLVLRLLRYMYRRPEFDLFYRALPIAGKDGTIRSRLKGTLAENNVHAKTGTLANARALSGYIRTAGGEMLGFCMIANHYNVPTRQADYLQDLALEILAQRKSSPGTKP